MEKQFLSKNQNVSNLSKRESQVRVSPTNLSNRRSSMGRTLGSSAGFFKSGFRFGEGNLDDTIYSENYLMKQAITQEYIDHCMEAMQCAGSILEEILDAQEEDRVLKWVKQVGKPFVAKSAISSALKAMQNTAFAFGDHHPEATWYDYDEEIVEPQRPFERYLGIKVHQRHTIDLSMLDTEFEPESSAKLSGSRKRT